jgi:hypothetical protein
MQPFEHTPPEARELLGKPIRELGLRLDGSPVEKYVHQLYRELEAKGLERFRPACYLSDEWACPDREPIIGIPFYLADPKLQAIERSLNDLEDEREILMYLRHEAGHAFNYAYELYETSEWIELFGPFDRPYIESYRPVPFSRRYVRHIAGWYAQKHPDEDFAETFAVWLTPRSSWRRRYAGWPALRKLEYVDAKAREFGRVEPKRALAQASKELPVDEMTERVEEFYRRTVPDEAPNIVDLVPDGELEDIFPADANPETSRPAAEVLSPLTKTLTDKIAYWTGLRRSLAKKLIEQIVRRARELDLRAEQGREEQELVDVTVLATTLAMNYLQRGQFTER